MGRCEICSEETSEGHSEEPVGEDYFTYVATDEEVPDGALNKQVFEFCSVEHLQLFTAPISQ